MTTGNVRGCCAVLLLHRRRRGGASPRLAIWRCLGACVEIKILRPRPLNHRVVLHAIDATPARWRGDACSSPLDRARTAASLPRNDLVLNCRVHPTHWLISTQLRRSWPAAAARRAERAGLSRSAQLVVDLGEHAGQPWRRRRGPRCSPRGRRGRGTCAEIKILRRVRAESPRRPPRHRRDACLMAWRCRSPPLDQPIRPRHRREMT